MNEFEVQVIDKDTGVERWLTVSAANKEEAKEKVAKLGEIVGEARLIAVPSTADQPHGTDRERRKYESDARSAVIFAAIGFFICGPVILFAWLWSANTHRKADLDFPGEDIGRNEHIICAVVGGVWLAIVIIYFFFQWLSAL